jgi:hypothetical protein
MIDKTVLSACVAVSLVLTSFAVAQANPRTSMSVIDANATQLCGAINANPTEQGVLAGFDGMYARGLDYIDGTLVIITAIHHVCPQHDGLIMAVLDAPAEELCTEPL